MMLRIIGNSCAWLSRKLNVIACLTAENLALRQQLIVLKRNQNRPKLKERDRLFWVLLSRIWSGWRDALLIVQPDTVVRWHRKAFKRYWRRKSRSGKRGRPALDSDVRVLILKMADANPLWGAPKIHGELLELGIVVSERTVSNLLRRHRRKPPSQTWRTFIKNHMPDMVGVDFLVVRTIRFRLLFVFVILSHARRRAVHFDVTANPTAEWTAQQIVEAFPWDTAPRYLLRDRDSIYGDYFRRRVRSMGIEEVLTTYHTRADKTTDSAGPPFTGLLPPTDVFQRRGARMLIAKLWRKQCFTCMWANKSAVEIEYKFGKVKPYRKETFCYGPRSCQLYDMGPPRQVPHIDSFPFLDEGWMDDLCTELRGDED